MTFTDDQLAVAIAEVSEHFFVTNDEDLITNRVLRRLFDNLIKDVRASRPLGTSFCALAKLAGEFDTVTTSMGHTPNRLAKRLRGKRVQTAIDGTLVELEFFGPNAKHRRASGTAAKDKRLYLEYRCDVVQRDPIQTRMLSPTDGQNTVPVSVVSIGNSDPVAILRDLPARIADQIAQLQPARKPWEVPPLPADFIGREAELSQITSAYDSGATNIFGLQGPSGIGKTALGLAAVAQLHDRFGASIYIDLRGNTDQPLTAADALRHVVRAFLPGASIPETLAELRALYHSILHETPTAVFVENIANAAQINELAPLRNSLLIASSILRLTSPGMLVCHLRPLEPESSARFVAQVAPRAASHAARVAELCGHYPIALRAAGHAIAEHLTVSVESYIQRLHDASTRLCLVDPTADKSVDAVIDVSYSLLQVELQERFDALAVFPATFDEPAAAAVWRCTAAEAHDTLFSLYRMSFVEYDPTANRYRLHHLLAVFAQARLRPSRAAALYRRFARYYRRLLQTEAWNASAASERPAKDALFLELPNIQKIYEDATAASTSAAARFLATFQWRDLKTAPLSRTAAISWLLSGTRCTTSPRQRRLAACNITRLALQYARNGDARKAVQELKRVQDYLVRFDDQTAIQNIVLTLHLIARLEAGVRDCVLAFLLQFDRSESPSATQGCVLLAIAGIYISAGLHTQARAFAQRAMASDCADDNREVFEFVALSAALSAENNDVEVSDLAERLLSRLSIGDSYDAFAAIVVAPQLAGRGYFELAMRFQEVVSAHLRNGSRIATDSIQLTTFGKAWYVVSLFGECSAKEARRCEEIAIELLTEAERLARAHGEVEHYSYSAIPLGLILASQGRFGRARTLLPASIYSEITRNGGARLRDVMFEQFSDIRS